jgi:Xaa-Pro aminopeptidase
MTGPIQAAQQYLVSSGIDGWLLRDYFDSNPVLWAVLGGHARNVTRPCWLFVPKEGRPVVLAHSVDAGRFVELFEASRGQGTEGTPEPGAEHLADIRPWASRAQLVEQLTALVRPGSTVAMEYSPQSQLPRVGRADAGSVELVRSLGARVVGSGDVLQFATERWTPEQLDSHRYAATSLVRIVHEAFRFVHENVNWKLTEHDVAQFIRGRYDRLDLEASDGPIASAGPHSSDPHYEPVPGKSAVVRKGSWLLLDIWARKKGQPDAIYADITWTGVVGPAPSETQVRVFEAVRDARDAAVRLIEDSWRDGRRLEGWEVDRAAREVIDERGFGPYFVHRLGHSLGTTVHSNAVNLDDWETHDDRQLIPGIGVTIEPGIYLPDFGVRSEIDVYLGPDGPEITTERQTQIVTLSA